MKQLEPTPDFICEPGKVNYCAYVDTDSNYINAKPLLEYLWSNYKDLDDKTKDSNAEAVAGRFEKEINEYYSDLAVECFNVPKDEEHFLEMKTECVIRSAYFRATRRYAQWITKQEGIEKDTLDIKGLEFMKANFPKILGTFFNRILEQVLKGAQKEDILEQIREFKKEIISGKISIIQLGNPTSVKKLDDYVGVKARAGEMFSGIKKGAPAAVKAAIRYNDLLRFWKLDRNYNAITKVDKIKWVYLKDNPYKIEALAFLDYDMPDKIKDFLEQFADRKNVFESILLNKLQGFFSDLEWELSLNPYANAFETIKI
tara:strand:+ start:74 stop:1018 length:945 start_codon:yes stop_codon:yes gene_type:complete